MKLLLVVVILLSLVPLNFGQTTDVDILPKPVSATPADGVFRLGSNTKIVASNDAGRRVATMLNEILFRDLGLRLRVTKKRQDRNAIVLNLQNMMGHYRSNEEYGLSVSPSLIQIAGDEPAGFYAVQSLRQLMRSSNNGIEIRSVGITDYPRFHYRGMHLDVSRHFQPIEFVKKFIDQMAQLKLNYFHWHLTDDQGWRIEIKKYPKLTEIGSRRPETHTGSYSPIFKGDGVPHGGFYTQEQIRDVVAYAKERYITVVPEIELPGHASAALAAYPELGKGCAAPDYKFEVKKTWGIFKEVFCPTDETFKFLEDVLDETIKLFPDSPYIHIGGDEVLKDFWKASAFVQEMKKKHNLKDEHEVQSYFVQRIERFINSKGKKIIGWDEILEGGLAPNATVMSWRGMKGGIEAAKSKHDVIMTPTDYVYLDYGQGDPAYEPLNIGSYVPLEKVYNFEPVPPELTADEAKYIIGAQANLWTEYIKTPAHVEYMAYPRMLALAEVAWSRKEDRNFPDFQRRLNSILPRLDNQNVNYRIPEPGGLKNIVTDRSRVSIELQPAPGTVVIYTTDGKDPDIKFSEQYREPIEVSLKDGEVRTLKTAVLTNSGRKSVVYAATIVRGRLREPDAATANAPGLNYSLVVPSSDFGQDPQPQKGETRSILLNQFAQKIDVKKSFGVQFDGYFRAPQDGVYEFQIDSTWDARFVVGDGILIDEAGTAESKKRNVIVPLKAGLHKMSLRYNHRGGESNFRFRWGIKGQGLRQAYGGEFVH